MRYECKPAFTDTFHRLPPRRKQKAKQAVRQLVQFFESGHRTPGLGLKKLRRNFWEIRADRKDRILFRLHGDMVEWVIVGSHDDIRRYLTR